MSTCRTMPNQRPCRSGCDRPECGDATPNPFLTLDAAAIDVLDDMVAEWLDKDRHGELNGGWGYGPRKSRALDRLHTQVKEAWRAKVRGADAEEIN